MELHVEKPNGISRKRCEPESYSVFGEPECTTVADIALIFITVTMLSYGFISGAMVFLKGVL